MIVNKEDVKPIGDFILYEVVVAERKTEAGLFLPGVEDAADPIIGRVIDVGQTVNNETMRVEKGSKILLSRGVSTKIPIGTAASREAVMLVDKKYILAQVK